MTADTKARLRAAAISTIRELGIAGVSARTVASRADCNQAAIYYHFGSLHDLLADACVAATQARVAAHRDRLASVTTVPELIEVAVDLHREERELGNVTVLAQMLAGAQTDEQLRAPTAAALQLWVDEVETTLDQLFGDNALATLVDVPALARTISAAFVGLELVDGVAGDGELPSMEAFRQLGGLAQTVIELSATE